MSYISDTSLPIVTFIYHLEIMNMDHMLNICNIVALSYVILHLDNSCLGMCIAMLPMTMCGRRSHTLLMLGLWRLLPKDRWLGSSLLFDGGIAQSWVFVNMVILGMFISCPLLTDCFMTRLSKRQMSGWSNLVHVLFVILLTYFVPIMFGRVVSYGVPST